MGKMTIRFNCDFDLTMIADVETAMGSIAKMVTAFANEETRSKMGPKETVFVGLITQAYERGGLEAAIIELMRFNIREGLNEVIRNEFTNDDGDTSVTAKVAPVRVKTILP